MICRLVDLLLKMLIWLTQIRWANKIVLLTGESRGRTVRQEKKERQRQEKRKAKRDEKKKRRYSESDKMSHKYKSIQSFVSLNMRIWLTRRLGDILSLYTMHNYMKSIEP